MCAYLYIYKCEGLSFSGSRLSSLRDGIWYVGYFLRRGLGNNICRTEKKEAVVSKRRNQPMTYTQ